MVYSGLSFILRDLLKPADGFTDEKVGVRRANFQSAEEMEDGGEEEERREV